MPRRLYLSLGNGHRAWADRGTLKAAKDSVARPTCAGPAALAGRGADRPLTEAERKLLDECPRGDEVEVGTGTRTETATEANEVRAPLLRFLLLGGDETHRPGPRGPMLRGAFVSGRLDFILREM
ncbi:hypothetical protein LHP98_09090 [Rhodobacter sp. Har01]|uniref:hypothetical protein n=1 Tax=Rhodobacter sp. Har01 TaxID=2883999 RepID=UPI001D079EB3|nr:hypothetical protein [Rhodobacter sp. Har01]MCB6178284.1 hypothetical protein [Rhodobacter sp. Har01]